MTSDQLVAVHYIIAYDKWKTLIGTVISL